MARFYRHIPGLHFDANCAWQHLRSHEISSAESSPGSANATPSRTRHSASCCCPSAAALAAAAAAAGIGTCASRRDSSAPDSAGSSAGTKCAGSGRAAAAAPRAAPPPRCELGLAAAASAACQSAAVTCRVTREKVSITCQGIRRAWSCSNTKMDTCKAAMSLPGPISICQASAGKRLTSRPSTHPGSAGSPSAGRPSCCDSAGTTRRAAAITAPVRRIVKC